MRLTKKAEPPPTRGVNPVKVRGPTGLYVRDSGTGKRQRLRRFVSPLVSHLKIISSLAALLRVK